MLGGIVRVGRVEDSPLKLKERHKPDYMRKWRRLKTFDKTG